LINIVSVMALPGWILYDAGSRYWTHPWPDSVDQRILYDQSRRIVEQGAYEPPQIFPYPPSAVGLMYIAALPAYKTAAAIWLALTILATAASIILGASLAGIWNHPWRWPAALVAFAFSDYFIQWDLRSQNCNMIYCFLLVAALVSVARQRDMLAGLLLAAAIALKLYPVLLVPYFWWTRKRKAVASTALFLGMFFILLPAALFGPARLVGVYSSWIQELRFISKALNQGQHPILISLPFLLAKKLGSDSEFIPWISWAARLVWLGAVGLCVVPSFRPSEDLDERWHLAAVGSVLALAPVVISPYLEVYHAVPALLAVLAIVRVVVDSKIAIAVRLAAAAGLIAGWSALKVSGWMNVRGFGVYAEMLIWTLSLAAIMRWQAWLPNTSAADVAKSELTPGQGRSGERCRLALVAESLQPVRDGVTSVKGDKP
jgi:hypothetical protein